MAEVVGIVASGVTLAKLLKAGLAAFDLIQNAYNQGQDYEKLSLLLTLERARLYTWGQTMGMTMADEQNAGLQILRSSGRETLVKSTLEMIIRIFETSDKIRDKYGCAVYSERNKRKHSRNTAGTQRSNSSVEHLSASFSYFRLHDPSANRTATMVKKAKWVIGDQKKFEILIQDIRQLINGLQEITKDVSEITRQENMVRCLVQEIKDHTTLQLLSVVCRENYPNISDAATTKLDVMSLTTDKHDINDWALTLNTVLDPGIEDLEDMTITELKVLVHSERSKRLRILQANEEEILGRSHLLKSAWFEFRQDMYTSHILLPLLKRVFLDPLTTHTIYGFPRTVDVVIITAFLYLYVSRSAVGRGLPNEASQ